MQRRISTALLSVHDKTGLVDFAREMAGMGIRLISTGGTARLLHESSLEVRDVSEITRSPEMLDGRVKTLHPHIHAALLAERSKPEHMNALKEQGIEPIDLVVVNLYPFEKVAADSAALPADLVENIDIGGVTLIRAAAKNFQDVAVVVSPKQYGDILAELRKFERGLSLATRLHLAQHAFEAVTAYDTAIEQELGGWSIRPDDASVDRPPQGFSKSQIVRLTRVRSLRYGENPHQMAAVYRWAEPSGRTLATAELLQGKELSYNNLLDLDAAWRLSAEFKRPTAVIIKHNNPCGVASADNLCSAYRLALSCDPVSAYGSVMAFNEPVDGPLAEEISKLFVEAIVAPEFRPEARELLSRKKNLRMIERPWKAALTGPLDTMEFRHIDGGFLCQTRNDVLLDESNLRVVTRRSPTEAEWLSLRFVWRVVKHVKSNAIVFASDEHTLGIGAGQMSRVDSVKIAAMKAQQSLKDSVVGSDAFFPFRDGVDEAVRAGATAFIQPGGSVRDEEVIQAANEAGAAMVFTGIRHFRH